jgi:Zn-dependent protease
VAELHPLEAVLWYVTFVFSATLHEAAHAWMAMLGGDRTAYHGGQVTLDPLPHMRREPMGMIGLPILSLVFAGWPFGFASAPYDPFWARQYPKRSAWMAAAGPLANLLLSFLAFGLLALFLNRGYLAPNPEIRSLTTIVTATTPFWQNLGMFLGMLFGLNLLLAVLNLIPLPPLDGSAMLPVFLSDSGRDTYDRLRAQPMFSLLGIIVAWNVVDQLFGRIFLPLLLRLYAFAS